MPDQQAEIDDLKRKLEVGSTLLERSEFEISSQTKNAEVQATKLKSAESEVQKLKASLEEEQIKSVTFSENLDKL